MDSSFANFNRLPEGRWLKGVDLQTTLDYVATGLPKQGDVVDGIRFNDRASPWSFSFVVAIPVAPF